MKITTIGLDLAKSVFQVHAVDGQGRVVMERRLRRGQVKAFFAALEPCVVGLEAGGGAHHWARVLGGLGHEVRVMAPQYVKPYVKTNKNDAADAAAICEAAGRPTMRFVAVKSAEQQAGLMLHRVRELVVRQRTMLINALRGHLAEFGVVAAKGARQAGKLVAALDAIDENQLPCAARELVAVLARQLADTEARLGELDRRLLAAHRVNETSQRLATIPGIGPITASAIVATVEGAQGFASARGFAAWIGLVPRQHSSGGKQRLGAISKRGNVYLRKLLIHGARAVVRWRRQRPCADAPWLGGLLARRPVNVAVTALANKNARVAWALLRRGGVYRSGPHTPTPAIAG